MAFGTSYKVIDATSLGASHKDARQDVTKAHRNAGMCRRSAKKRRDDPELSGFLAGLPQELLDDILDRCTAVQLAQLETTCLFFKATKIVQNTAESKLKAVPRAKGLAPNKRYVHLRCLPTVLARRGVRNVRHVPMLFAFD